MDAALIGAQVTFSVGRLFGAVGFDRYFISNPSLSQLNGDVGLGFGARRLIYGAAGVALALQGEHFSGDVGADRDRRIGLNIVAGVRVPVRRGRVAGFAELRRTFVGSSLTGYGHRFGIVAGLSVRPTSRSRSDQMGLPSVRDWHRPWCH